MRRLGIRSSIMDIFHKGMCSQMLRATIISRNRITQIRVLEVVSRRSIQASELTVICTPLSWAKMYQLLEKTDLLLQSKTRFKCLTWHQIAKMCIMTQKEVLCRRRFRKINQFIRHKWNREARIDLKVTEFLLLKMLLALIFQLK